MAQHATRSVFALLACAGTAPAQVPTIANIDVLPGGAVSTCRGVSGNGRVAVGNCLLFGANRSVVWSSGIPLLDLGLLPGHTSSDGNAASANGSVIVGADRAPNLLFRAFRWSSPGPKQDLGMLPGQTTAQARDVSADGQVVVGDCGGRAFRWTSASGMVDLGVLPGGVSAIAWGVSSDGSVVAGTASVGGTGQAFRWTAATGMVGLGTPPGGTSSNAFGLSGDGTAAVGTWATATSTRGFRWTESGGMEDLGQNVTPVAVNGDGSVVLGAMPVGTSIHAFMWTPELGVVDLNNYLVSRGANLTGWLLTQGYGVNEDGNMIVGWGTFNGVARGWVVNLDPDTDGDGLRDSWEMIGIPYKDDSGVTHRYELPGADPMHKNLYVEVDAMSGFGLDPEAVLMVMEAFENSPVPNPVAPTGITLFIELDETDLPHRAVWQTNPDNCWPQDFDDVRTAFYGAAAERADPDGAALLEAKAKAYRYCIIADRAGPFHWGGCGAKPGDNFVLFATTVGAVTDRHASAFMHELGHNLGLTHGGADGTNGKPNYPSIMNYPLAYKYRWARDFWRLDYSRAGSEELRTLNENSLDERFGIGIANGQYSNYFMPFGINVVEGGATVRRHDYVRLMDAPVDFGNTAGTGFQDGFFDPGIRQDLNYLTQPPPGIRLPSTPSPGETLTPCNDWAIISLPLSTVRDGNAPIPSFAADELTEEAIAWIDQTFRDPAPLCYANCDGSTAAPILNVNDFVCFQTRFAAGDSYANCDGSTTPPVLNVNDFICFQTSFAAGCP